MLVDAAYHRTGVGLKLGRWVTDMQDDTDRHLLCLGTPDGRMLYLALGCVEVAAAEALGGSLLHGFIRRPTCLRKHDTVRLHL